MHRVPHIREAYVGIRATREPVETTYQSAEGAFYTSLGRNPRSSSGEVDGHDFGAGECNIFILKNDPRSAFEYVKEHLFNEEDADWKAAFRDVNQESFTVLWPSTETTFEIA